MIFDFGSVPLGWAALAGYRGCSRAGAALPSLFLQAGCLGTNWRVDMATPRGPSGEAERGAGE